MFIINVKTLSYIKGLLDYVQQCQKKNVQKSKEFIV